MKFPKVIWLFLVFLLLLSYPAYGSSGDLRVTDTAPNNGDTKVALNSLIIIYFNTNVELGWEGRGISMYTESGTRIRALARVVDNNIFLETEPLKNNTKYIIKIGAKDVLDKSGNSLDEAYSFSFTTESDLSAPVWQESSSLTANNINPGSIGLSWDEASDNGGVKAYKVFKDGTEIAKVEKGHTYTVENLAPDTEYTFKIEAGDVDENWSTNGPSLTITTKPAPPPLKPGEIRIVVNGKTVSSDISPVIEQGRTLVPIRVISENIGATVGWDGKSKTVTVTMNQKVVMLKIGNKYATVNGKNINLDVPAKILNGRTLVPLRFIGESLGATVTWDGTTRTVTIIKS